MLTQIKALFLSLLGLLRRAMCCFSRRRKHSVSESESLQCVNVIGDKYPNKSNSHGEQRDWNSWDDTPRTVEEHIELYRKKITVQKEEQPEPDYFSEMAPRIKPQLKYYLEPDQSADKQRFSRLEAQTDVPIVANADLEDWIEEDPTGWEEQDTETTKQLIREKRRELRHQKQINQKLRKNESGNDDPIPDGRVNPKHS